MSLFTYNTIDVVFVFFISVAALRYFLNKESKGLKLIVDGGLILLMQIFFSNINWDWLNLSNVYGWFSVALYVISIIFVVIGTIKLILESFQ
jgi:signal transduction histidine kinase